MRRTRLGPALLALTLGVTLSWESLARRGDDAPAAAPTSSSVSESSQGAPSPGDPAVWVTAFEDSTLHPTNVSAFGLPSTDGVRPLPVGLCPTWEARAGRCLDFVRFATREQLFAEGPARRVEEEEARAAERQLLALRQGLSSLYLALWDGLVGRWRRDGDALGAQLKELGITDLPDSIALWGASGALGRRVTALPDATRWLLEEDWIAPSRAFQGRAPFRRLRTRPTTTPQAALRNAPEFQGAPIAEPPELTLLRGRFAERLIFQGAPFDTDLIRLYDDGAKLFLRQLYPHKVEELRGSRSSRAGCESSVTPLECLGEAVPAVNSPLRIPALPAIGDAQPSQATRAERAAREQFTAFSDLLSMRLLQYGRFEYDVSLVRVLGALMAMSEPPRTVQSAGIPSGTGNDSLPGETDPAATGLRARAPRPANSATSIYYDGILDEQIGSLTALLELTGDERCLGGAQEFGDARDSLDPTAASLRVIDHTFIQLGELIREDSPLYHRAADGGGAPTDETLEEATARYLLLPDREFRQALLSGNDIAYNSQPQVTAALDRIILENRLEGRCAPEDEAGLSGEVRKRRRERLRGRVLLALVQDALVEQLPTAGKDPATPADVEAAAEKSWSAVLAQHGSTPKPTATIGEENVHPLVVCTTKDGNDALTEPVFKRISVELLFVADADTPPDAALWEARAASPFLWMDDPSRSRPQVERLVRMGEHLAIFKARWELWAGWHLLWGVREEGAEVMVTGFASAICEDMVLAPPTLVPTLVRGGLLDAPLRGTRPVRRADVPDRDAPEAATPPPMTSDERLATTQGLAEAGLGAAGTTELTLSQVQANPDSAMDLAKSKGAQAKELAEGRREPLELTGRDADAAEYLRSLVQGPLLDRAAGRSSVIIVADVTRERRWIGARQLIPSTPYLQRREWIGDGEWLRLAAWALLLPARPLPMQEPNIVALPARLPKATVQATSVRPGWSVDPLTEMTLVADLGFFGRQVDIACDAALFAPGYPAFEGCYAVPPADSGGALPVIARVYSEGPSLSIASLGTTWLGHEPRLAIEYGVEAQLELVLREQSSWMVSDLDKVPLSWAINARGGLLVGVRLARDPAWLTRAVSARRLESGAPAPRLWGAEGDDGRAQLARTQLGLRAGAHLEPWATVGGPPVVMSAEAWVGWSRWRPRSVWATITPYQPSALVGPYVRYLYAVQAPWWEPGEAPSAALDELQLSDRHQLVIGVRVQPRFDAARFEVPEVQ